MANQMQMQSPCCCGESSCTECFDPEITSADSISVDFGDGATNGVMECCTLLSGTIVLGYSDACDWVWTAEESCDCSNGAYGSPGQGVVASVEIIDDKCVWLVLVYEGFGVSDSYDGPPCGGRAWYASAIGDPDVSNGRDTGPWTLQLWTGGAGQYTAAQLGGSVAAQTLASSTACNTIPDSITLSL